MNFVELSDDEWTQVSSLVSDEPPIRLNRRGRPRAEPRVVANAVLWILTTGESWSRLPARYPSGPTCRRRFEEWHVNGTLIELVGLLSQGGRQFVYVPEPAQQPAVQAVAVVVEEVAEDDGQPAVYWKSPEAWQAPTAAVAALVETPFANSIESMTRQLAGGEIPAAAHAHVVPVDKHVAPVASPVPVAAVRAGADATHGSSRMSTPASRAVPLKERVVPPNSEASPGGATQVAQWRGFVLSLTVQPVRNRMFRAAVEILQEGQRVERSGLIGPSFQDRDDARDFAFGWAREWIDREHPGAPAAAASPALAHAVQQTVSRSAQQSGAEAASHHADTARTEASANSGAVVTRTVPAAAAPGSMRLAPVQRYTATGALLSSESRDTAASTPASGTAERRPFGTRMRTHLG
ncbi:transposase [Paraburkholderia acidisoli]|uniref:Transposase n=1 Tax=Paraburkholderia acidisoli TaxID=2571748 RepID=A0A7Z2GL46_9BURK|nr:transposase [Paraburkholderia acidisoli]QGZ63490.1 transposase [Paraburkholderia acidisoli]